MSGSVVRYPNGYPDFSPYERQRVDVPDLQGNHSRTGNGDFAKADAAAPKGKANYDLNTWHHHENGKTMQEVPKKYIGLLHIEAAYQILRKNVNFGEVSCQ
ncbi:hypothetical protein ACSLVK_10325 [Photorhabdus tasmaniensis]|uniref:hypothetical protein n=1 Tax=Photorhabdus tasmaniensis TaxID=1004159 RepID=UPI004042AC0B